MPMLLCDAQTLTIMEANKAAISFYGYSRQDLLRMAVQDMHAQEQASRFARMLAALGGDREGKTVWRQHTASGVERHVLIYVRILREGGLRRLLLTVADVSERIAAESHGNHLALHDALTGLSNRMQFLKAVDVASDEMSDPGRLMREADNALYRAKAAGKNTWRLCRDLAA